MRRIAGIVLAGGASRRLGKPKQLILFRGETLLRRAARAAVEAGCDPVTLVLGADAETARREIRDLAIRIVVNERWAEGIASSLRAGLTASEDAQRVLIALCDQPLVGPERLRQLIEAANASRRPIVASYYGDAPGVPAIFDRSVFPELLALTGDAGAKRVILADPSRVELVDLPEAEIDIDTAGDLLAFESGAAPER